MHTKFAIVIVFFLGLSLSIEAQTFGRGETKSSDSLIVDLADYLPPLNLLIDSAVANSPQIEYYGHRQKMFEYEMAMNRKRWMEGVRFGMNYIQGNNAINEGGGLLIAGFNYGVNVSIPLSTFFGQQDQARMAKAASDGELANKRLAVLEIQTKVEETYSRLFMLRELIKEATDAAQSAQFIYEQAENAFVRGEIGLEELGQNADLRGKWTTNYITLKTEFYDTYRQLERLVGVPFSKFEKD